MEKSITPKITDLRITDDSGRWLYLEYSPLNFHILVFECIRNPERKMAFLQDGEKYEWVYQKPLFHQSQASESQNWATQLINQLGCMRDFNVHVPVLESDDVRVLMEIMDDIPFYVRPESF